jgi:hypothetical protein
MRSLQSRSRARSCWRRCHSSLDCGALARFQSRSLLRPAGSELPAPKRRQAAALRKTFSNAPSIVIRIPSPPEGREKLKALDARLQLVADLLRASDQIVDLEQALFLLHIDIE